MPEVNLSNAVRSNLLSLQNTATLLEKTQNKLSTGLKVNSALDDPSAFFTASSLNSRAGDLSRLLDSTSNGIQTIQAADNGLSAITKTVESLQANVNQARQDASFKSTSFTLDSTTIGTATAKTLDLTGGSVGTTPVSIALNTADTGPVTQSTVVASADYVAPTAASAATASTITATNVFTAIDLSNNADNTLTFDIDLGGTTKNIVIEQGDGNIDIDEAIAAIQADLDAGPALGVTVGKDGAGTRLTFTANAAGATALTVDNVAVNGTGVPAAVTDLGIADAATTGETDTGDAAQAAVDRVITISDGTETANITLTSANAGDAATARTYIDAQLTAAGVEGITVGNTGGANRISLTGLANGTNDITVGGADVDDVFGAGRTVTAGVASDGSVKTVDELVTDIAANTALDGKIRATNDNGKLRIENLSLDDLTATGKGTGGIDGSTGTDTIGGNTVRQDLANQFNVLRTELNKLADDSGFNGINLLRGDVLKLNFNESGTSNIEIQAKDSAGAVRAINTTNLGIGSSTNAEFGSNTSLDTRRESLNTALSTLRTQASQFGSSLSIVQNRQDFTKNTINTLETGAANLTLADTNLEGANLLALQTRQQLSSTALSLASQADQNVLRLF